MSRNPFEKMYGRSLLHSAAEGAHLGAVQVLLKRGVSEQILDDAGHTALEIAVRTRAQIERQLSVVSRLSFKGLTLQEKVERLEAVERVIADTPG